MTQDKFNEMMNTWLTKQATNEQVESYSAEARAWAEQNELVKGDSAGRKMYKKFITREEFITILYRFFKNVLKK